MNKTKKKKRKQKKFKILNKYICVYILKQDRDKKKNTIFVVLIERKKQNKSELIQFNNYIILKWAQV